MIVSDSFWGGVSAIDFAKQMTAIDAKTIHLRINSPGGEVFAGQAMAQIIREHAAHHCPHRRLRRQRRLLGRARRRRSRHFRWGMIMIHNSNTIAYGNARDLQDTAALLEKIDGILVATYAEATGQDPSRLPNGWPTKPGFTSEEAVQNRFADRIATDSGSAPDNVIQWNLTAWTNAPVTNHPSSRKSAPLDHLRRRLRLAEAQNA